jgi:hypothetical protein
MTDYLRMGPPPWSNVTVSRAGFKGRCFRVTEATTLAIAGAYPAAAENELDRQFQRFGAAFALALLDVKESPARNYPRRLAAAVADLSREAEAVEQFSARCLEAVSKAGVPDEIGVFLPRDERSGVLKQQPRALELAILARRSGFLYLPQRPIDASLISWSDGTLFFPEGSPIDSPEGSHD